MHPEALHPVHPVNPVKAVAVAVAVAPRCAQSGPMPRRRKVIDDEPQTDNFPNRPPSAGTRASRVPHPVRSMDPVLQQWRADTPGCAHRIHLNNAGAGLMPRSVLETAAEHLMLESEIGGYEAADTRAAEVGRVYDAVAALVG